MPARADDSPRVLADGWYSWLLDDVPAFTEWAERLPRPLARLMLRRGSARGVGLFAASLRRDRLAVLRTDAGWRTLLLLRGLLGRRRKLVVLHFIDHPPPPRGRARLVDRLWRPLDRRLTRRSLLVAQVLAPWEAGVYAARFGLPAQRFRHLPFAWRTELAGKLPPPAPDGPVVAAGRAHCDWPTLFAAADGAPWPLVVVCGAHDLPEVRGLNAGGRATVLCDLPDPEVHGLLRGASACAVVMHDAGVSHGQVRVRDAVDAGAPVVATRTRSLTGYVEDGRTAVLVPEGDAGALRGAIDRLVEAPQERERLRRNAWERAAAWTWADYLAEVERLICGK